MAQTVTERSKALLSTLHEALRDKRMVWLWYRGGNKQRYLLEPYEYKRGLFYGYDVYDKHIKKFKLPKIKKVQVLSPTFKARWPVKPIWPVPAKKATASALIRIALAILSAEDA